MTVTASSHPCVCVRGQALDGDDEDGRTLLLSLPAESVPFLIGKSGATINKFRDELGVDITLLRVRSQVGGPCNPSSLPSSVLHPGCM